MKQVTGFYLGTALCVFCIRRGEDLVLISLRSRLPKGPRLASEALDADTSHCAPSVHSASLALLQEILYLV